MKDEISTGGGLGRSRTESERDVDRGLSLQIEGYCR
jgi:hypothetical protein